MFISPSHQLQTAIRPRPLSRDRRPATPASNRNGLLAIAIDPGSCSSPLSIGGSDGDGRPEAPHGAARTISALPSGQRRRGNPIRIVQIWPDRLATTLDPVDKLAAARAAFAARDWTGAHDGFVTARHDVPLDADDLNALAEAAWWLGLMDESLEAREAAYGLYLEASDNRRAAMRAFDIAYAYFLRGNETVGGGWVNRAQRLRGRRVGLPRAGLPPLLRRGDLPRRRRGDDGQGPRGAGLRSPARGSAT